MSIEITLTDELTIVCNLCGRDLDASTYNNEIVVDPCDFCFDEAREEGKKEATE
jgi:hypothetical protein